MNRTRIRTQRDVPASLVRAPCVTRPPRVWEGRAADLVAAPLCGPESAWSPVRITGSAGTGKTALLVDAAVARLADPAVDPESVLVLTSDRRSAVRIREEITARLLNSFHPDSAGADSGGSDAMPGGPQPYRSTREPLVRTVHSYAFAVLRLQASVEGNPPPRLITSSEQDAVLRELLAGDIADGAQMWPQRLRPALATDGFAQALRDVMMRAAERGVGPEQLITLGRTYNRDEWVASGIAYRQYEQTTLLRAAVGVASPQASAPAVDAAELIGSALSALSADAELLRAERGRIRHLFVDDAQHLDPQAARLVQLIGTGTAETVVGGDRDQTIYTFRGASPAFIDELIDPMSHAAHRRDVVLTQSHRAGSAIVSATSDIAARLPGVRKPPTIAANDVDSRVSVAVYSSVAKQAAAIADTMRRAHLFEGVAWSSMAVIVRSVPRSVGPLRRALRTAGIPVVTAADETRLYQQRAVAALLLVLQAAEHAVDADEASALLVGPIGGCDPIALRRLRRGIRRAADQQDIADDAAVLTAQLMSPTVDDADAILSGLTDIEIVPLRRIRTAVAAAAKALATASGVDDVLWSAWEATGLQRRWAATALRGGPAADQADRDLDAVIELFDVAASFTDNLPAATMRQFIDHVRTLRIASAPSRRAGIADAVTICSAHAAAGREWDVVAVADVLDGRWPSLRSRGSILSAPQLVDLLDGVAADALDTVSRPAVALADERRLFLVACSRARRALLVTAVDDGSGDAAPSRFILEMAAAQSVTESTDGDPPPADDMLAVSATSRRILTLPSLVAALRVQVCADDPDPRMVELLARLAHAGVLGAHPDEWAGIAAPSTDTALWDMADGPVSVSPSAVEALRTCSLRWFLERNGGRDGDSAPAVAGTLVHTLVQGIAGDMAPDDVTAALHRAWRQVDVGAPWFSAHELARAEDMLNHFSEWLSQSRAELDVIGVEVDVDALLPANEEVDGAGLVSSALDSSALKSLAPESRGPVRIRGRIDRLEADSDGNPVVVDVKTGKSIVSKDDATHHAQLAAYQLALSLGGVRGVEGAEPGGGRLVYVNQASKTSGATERIQPALTAEQIDEWKAIVRDAAASSIGPHFHATVNAGCSRCPVESSCPARIAGKSVADD